MSQQPPEWMKNMQAMAQQQGRRFGAGGGGGPKAPISLIAGVVLLGGASYAFSNSIFNGKYSLILVRLRN